MELQTRSATFEPSTFNAERGTVDAVISAGADVTRRDYQGLYKERLNMNPSAWTARGTVPVLKDHQRAVDSVIGRAENIRIDSGRALATIRLSDRPDLAGIRRDVETGILDSLSFGFTVPKWREFSEDGARVREAEQIVVHEVSFVPIGADPQAKTRSEVSMENQQEQVRSIALAVGVAAPFADDLIQRGLSVEDARTAIIREAARNVPHIDNRAPAVVTREAAPEDLTRAAGEALYCRIDPTFTPSDQARPFVGRRLADVARDLLRQRGLNTFGSDAEIITRSLNTTSDLANVVGVFANKAVAQAYQTAPSGIKVLCKHGASHPDFRGRNLIRRGELPTLEKVNEKGEFTRGSILDDRQSYAVATYGKVFGMSRQLIINDDLGLLADIASGWGLAAMEFENQTLVDLLTTNSGAGPKLADDKSIFDAAHGNLAASGGAVSDTTLSAARLALRSMKGLNGAIPINATARYLLVPAALETAAEKYLASIYPNAPSGVNPFSGTLTLVVDPRLDANSVTRWYTFADPAVLPVIEYAYLSGFEGVQILTRNGFDVSGVEIRAQLDYGAGGIDFRGAYANPGN
ncbi:MAG TPA: HK97 family phage prohead protease [Bryobacteraceae bacterium]|nr:HK97 family phage prohead protease [Bryobacteraceae bacterium]